MLGRTTIEAKLEFLQVAFEVLGAGRALVRARQPAFQDTDDPMHLRKQSHGSTRVLADNRPYMDISPRGQLPVAVQAIGADPTAPRHVAFDGGGKAFARMIGHARQANMARRGFWSHVHAVG